MDNKLETIIKLKQDVDDGLRTLTWAEIGTQVSLSGIAARGRWRRAMGKLDVPTVENVAGFTATDVWPHPKDVLEEAGQKFEERKVKEELKRSQEIKFSHGPVGIAFVADQHFGDSGVDTERAIKDAELIRDTPGLYCFQVGDLVNTFILKVLSSARMNDSMDIRKEWTLAKLYLEILRDKWLGALDGNHEQWVETLTGIPWMAEIVGEVTENALYDPYEILTTIVVGKESWILKVRHSWGGRSQDNPFHGIMRAAKRDRPFHIGVGAHDHSGAMVATFRVSFNSSEMEKAAAIKCGTYKIYDDYMRKLGLPAQGPKIVPVVVLQDNPRNILVFDELQVAVSYLDQMYQENNAKI